MKLKDMKQPPPKPIKESTTGYPMERDRYPYGLRLDLSTDIIDKLGIGGLNTGMPVLVVAKAEITQKSENEEQGPSGKTKTRKSMTIQLQKLGIEHIKNLDQMSMPEFMKARNK